MKGYRFYLDKTVDIDNSGFGSVIALETEYEHSSQLSIVGGATHGNNPSVCSSAASREYFSARCTRISEFKARRLHPALFVYLDDTHHGYCIAEDYFTKRQVRMRLWSCVVAFFYELSDDCEGLKPLKNEEYYQSDWNYRKVSQAMLRLQKRQKELRDDYETYYNRPQTAPCEEFGRKALPLIVMKMADNFIEMKFDLKNF